ncbi:titin-like isoform X5 [Homarus americanus]|uniref:titin-like isoform X5 n=1 Tax=Homarus americanus TaxID=6706 RepID=UPI001C438970|nr:titin-like isoform X5 [Homarus americanus]
MLSSCWFTTPFTGCFTTAIKGGVGSGMQEGGDGEPRVRVSQSEERSRRFLQPSHRSRSEGPLGRDLDDDSFLVSEYKTQFAWVRKTPSARGPRAAPLLEAEKPPPQSTKSQVNANGVAGGASGAAGGAAPASDPNPPADQQLPRTPRKSKSMGRIHGGGAGPEVGGEGAAGGPEAAGSTQQQQQQGGNQEGQHDQAPPPPRTDAAAPTQHWHRGHRRTPSDGVAWRHSKGLEADRIIGGEMLGSGEDDKLYKRAYKSEYRKKFRPFSQYQYVDGRFHKVKADEATAAAGTSESPNNWYKEVIELRRQAGQYRARHDIGDVWRTVQHRGWGVETASERLAEIYSKQAELWEQVSRRSSLQALSLASASPSRPISKAEKEIENSRRSSPIKHVSKSSRERPSTAPPKPKPAAVHTQKPSDKTDGKTSKESTPRHHYERTTGTTEEGLLITSPSRDKLEPFIPDDWSSRRSSRRTPPITSPMKDGPSRRRSNRASSAARPPPTKDCRSSVGGRSVSVGPENRSPKRTSRPPSTHATAPATKPERRPRPTSLSTSARRKGTDALPHRPSSHDEGREPKKASKAKPHDPTASPKKGEDKSKVEKKHISEETDIKKDKEKEILPKDGPKDILKDIAPKDGSKEPVEAVKESTARKSTPEPRFDPEKYEPVVKTPPEPTRVKSPDQVMVKSPDPVNWTVPLDTGKTFTVTHNIPEGESARGTPSSEYRHVLESRTRQTPEPTKISQGSLAGTPVSSIASEAKSHSQEQPKPITATTVDPKVDDKSVEKKPDPTHTPDTKITEGKPLEGDKFSSKLDAKASETKPYEIKKDTKLAEVKEEPKPTTLKELEKKSLESKVPETKPFESKVPETKPFESKVPEIKPFESKVPEAKPFESKLPETKPFESKVPETKPFESKVPEAKPFESKVPEIKPFESKVPETKPFESKVPEIKPFESKVPETKPFESKVPEIKPFESKVPETKPFESKMPEIKPKESLVPEPKSTLSMAPDTKAPEMKAPEPKKPEPTAELKKSEPPFDSKLFQSQPLQQQQQQQQGPSSPPAPTQASPMDIVPPSGAVDSMTMSMFGSLNGMNGKSSGTPSPTKPEVPLPSEQVKDASVPESKPVGVRNVPGTNLRCLDDPSFMFDQPSAPTTNSPKSGAYKVLEAPVEPQQPKSGGYRVLEAPEAPSDIKDLPDQSPTKPETPIKPSPYRVLEAPIDPPARPKGSPYRVLEAPDAPYYPQTQSVGEVQESKPPSLVSPSSGRTVTDALDKARTRFDSFWGGPKDKDPPSKV